jgi:hypothetical protein
MPDKIKDDGMKSSSDEWEIQMSRWEVGGEVHRVIRLLSDSFADISNAIRIVNESNSAGYDNIGNPKLSFTRSDIEQLDEDRKRLAEFCAEIHDEMIDLVDAPFASAMGWITDGLFSVSPNDVTITRDVAFGIMSRTSLFDMMSPRVSGDESALRSDFNNRYSSLDEEPSSTLREAIIAALARTYSGRDIRTITAEEKRLLIRYYEALYPDHMKIMDDFLSPLDQDGLDDDIMNIKFITYIAPEHYRTVMLKHLPSISIMDHNHQGTQYYSSRDRGIYVNLSVDGNRESFGINDSLGPYYTFFHEVGHGIDFAMGGRGGRRASEVLFDSLEKAVFDDIQRVVDANARGNSGNAAAVMEALKYNGDVSLLYGEQIDIYIRVLNEYLKKRDFDLSHIYVTVTDVFGGFTENKVISNHDGERIFRGHGLYNDDDEYLDYWLYSEILFTPTRRQNREFYAGNFSSQMLQIEDQIAANNLYFPEATKMMDDLIREHAAK